MTEQDRLSILYILTLRDIDHAERPVAHAVKYLLPVVLLILVLAFLATALHLSTTQASALLLATVPASTFAYVGWSNTHDDRVEALQYRAAELRLLLEDAPAGAARFKSAEPIEKAIRDARGHANPEALEQGLDPEFELSVSEQR